MLDNTSRMGDNLSNMNLNDIKQHYGSIAKAAAEIGVHRQAVYRWNEGVPIARQIEFEERTGGVLKADRPWSVAEQVA